MSIKFAPELVGKPFTWRTQAYGDVAVHVKLFSPNGGVALVSIDGGEAATPCQRFPELSDGTGFAVEGQLFKRVSRRTKPTLPAPNQVRNVSAKEAAAMVIPARAVTAA
jgi:hypothetical protein